MSGRLSLHLDELDNLRICLVADAFNISQGQTVGAAMKLLCSLNPEVVEGVIRDYFKSPSSESYQVDGIDD